MKKVLVLFAAVVFTSSVALAEKMKCPCPPEMQCACISADMKDGECKCRPMMMKKEGFKSNMFAKKFKKFQDQLNLTEEQTKSVEALNAAQKEKQMPIKEEIKKLKDAEIEAMKNSDYETAKTKVREIAVLEGDLKANAIDYKKSVMEILTADQKDKFKELVAKAKEEKKEEMKDKKDKKDNKDKKDKKEKSGKKEKKEKK